MDLGGGGGDNDDFRFPICDDVISHIMEMGVELLDILNTMITFDRFMYSNIDPYARRGCITFHDPHDEDTEDQRRCHRHADHPTSSNRFSCIREGHLIYDDVNRQEAFGNLFRSLQYITADCMPFDLEQLSAQKFTCVHVDRWLGELPADLRMMNKLVCYRTDETRMRRIMGPGPDFPRVAFTHIPPSVTHLECPLPRMYWDWQFRKNIVVLSISIDNHFDPLTLPHDFPKLEILTIESTRGEVIFHNMTYWISAPKLKMLAAKCNDVR